MEALAHMDPQRHPWLEELLASPQGAVAQLLAGRAEVFPYTRADAPDAARMLVGHLPADDPARLAMASGMSAWLHEKRVETLPSHSARLQDFVRQVSEAYEIVSLLELTETALDLREKYVRWFEWSSRLNLAPSRDALASYFRVLANTQPLVAESVSEPDALAPFWMRLCKESGSTYPKRYLQIGLLGLRRLPGAIERGESPWIAGLAAWALEQSPSDKAFMRAWLPIKRLHPAGPKVLKRRVYDVLSQKHYADAGIAPPGWWSSDADFPSVQNAKGRGRHLEPPAPDFREGVIRDLRDGVPFSDLKKRLDDLVWRYEQYTNYTGEDDFLVRSFCNVGFEILRSSAGSPVEKSQFSEKLARRSLRHQPENPIAWGLWRDSLFARGAFKASVTMGWETIRRFPNNPFMRTELSEILIALGRPEEAFDILEDAIASNAISSFTYGMLARLSASKGDLDAARSAVDDGLEVDPDDRTLLNFLALLDEGKTPSLASAARKMVVDGVEVAAQDNVIMAIERTGRLRSLRQRLSTDDSAVEELKGILGSDPNFAYAQILAARQKIWHASEHGLPSMAASFEEALAYEDLERLQALTEQLPRLESVILLARAILGDTVAASEVASRLLGSSTGEDAQAVLLLRPRFQPVLRLIEGGLEPSEAVAKCADQLRTAIFDTNEALSVPELMVA